MSNSFIAKCIKNNSAVLEVGKYYIITKCDKYIDTYNTWVELDEDDFMQLSFNREELGEHFVDNTPIYGDLPSPSRSNKLTDEEMGEAESSGVTVLYISGVSLIVDNCIKCGEWYAQPIGTKTQWYCNNCIQ